MAEDNRIFSTYDLQGAFWRPATPEQKFSARLTKTKQSIHLTTSPILGKIDHQDDPFKPERIELLHGSTAQGLCTLMSLRSGMPGGLTDYGSGVSLKFREYRVDRCLFGLHLSGVENEEISRATFAFTGLKAWISWKPEISFEEKRTIYTHIKSVPRVIDFSSLSFRTHIEIDVNHQTSLKLGGDFKAHHDPLFIIEPAEPKMIGWFFDLGSRLESLLSLLLGASIKLTRFQVESDSKKGWMSFVSRTRTERPSPDCWVRCDSNSLSYAIANWFSLPVDFRPLENLIYGTIRGSSLFVETEFLSLAQALESVHRLTETSKLGDSGIFKTLLKMIESLLNASCADGELRTRMVESLTYSNEPNSRTRNNELLSRLSEPARARLLENPELFEKQVRQTRNYFTHPGIAKQKHVVGDAGGLFMLNQKLHALIRLLLLMNLGFSEESVVDAVLAKANGWSLL